MVRVQSTRTFSPWGVREQTGAAGMDLHCTSLFHRPAHEGLPDHDTVDRLRDQARKLLGRLHVHRLHLLRIHPVLFQNGAIHELRGGALEHRNLLALQVLRYLHFEVLAHDQRQGLLQGRDVGEHHDWNAGASQGEHGGLSRNREVQVTGRKRLELHQTRREFLHLDIQTLFLEVPLVQPDDRVDRCGGIGTVTDGDVRLHLCGCIPSGNDCARQQHGQCREHRSAAPWLRARLIRLHDCLLLRVDVDRLVDCPSASLKTSPSLPGPGYVETHRDGGPPRRLRVLRSWPPGRGTPARSQPPD